VTPHDHRTFVPGCYRCELSRDEAADPLADPVEVPSTCGTCDVEVLPADVLAALTDEQRHAAYGELHVITGEILVTLTADECRAIKLAMIFGTPDPTPPSVESARRKLAEAEREAS
jgi:hypothetical protein